MAGGIADFAACFNQTLQFDSPRSACRISSEIAIYVVTLKIAPVVR
ncbi:hypothetical protein [Belnapia moabensis]|nr:hypothetical protein [Belnapia moabensis]